VQSNDAREREREREYERGRRESTNSIIINDG
jgi:hypothetical protein